MSSDDRLDRLYERLGPRWTIPFIFMCMQAVSVPFTVLNATMMKLYLDLENAEWLRAIGVVGIVATLGIAASALRFAPSVLRLWRWLGAGAPADDAAWVFRFAQELPRRAVPLGAVVIMVLEIPVILYIHGLSDADVSPVITFVACCEGVAAAAVFVYLLFERMIRPIARRALRIGAVEFVPSLALRRKLLIGLPLLNIFTAYVAVGVATEADRTETALTVGVVAAVVVSLTLSLVLTVTFSRLVSQPAEELVAAAERVERGDLTARVEPLSGDELGLLATRFNRMADELIGSRARIVAASDEARRKVERDLHDGAQQRLVLLRLRLGQLKRGAERGEAVTPAMLQEAADDLTQALAELRDLAHGIYPAVLESDGLASALREAAARAALPVSVESNGAGRFAPELEAAVYFCCLEALQNAGKHAGEGARASVTLSEHDGKLRFEVADDGAGFEGTTSSGGLQNMADRIGALGGELRIASRPGAGTRVSGSVPA